MSVLKIHPSSGLKGVVNLPGDKSISHRALLFGALAEDVSKISNCLIANVTYAMVDCLTSLGVRIEISNASEYGDAADVAVVGVGLKGFSKPLEILNCRGSATTMRMLAGVLAGQPFESTLDGNERLRIRPMGRIVEPLRTKGAKIETSNNCAPLTFYPSSLNPSEAILSVASAQVKSALLLAGLFSNGPTVVIEPSASRDHTERMLRNSGVPVQECFQPNGSHVVKIDGQVRKLSPINMRVPSDPSSAAFILTSVLMTSNSEVVIPNLSLNPGRTGFLETLIQMGAEVGVTDSLDIYGEPCGTIVARSSKLKGTTIKGPIVARMIDEFPILAVAATQAHGETAVRDAGELRLKESDRIDAIAQELTKMGARISTYSDGLTISGPVKLRGALVDSRGDHRLAMSLAVAALVAEGETHIQGWEVINDSFPSFLHTLKALGAEIE